MTILHISSIVENKSNGMCVVIPEHVINQSKFANVAMYNCIDYVPKNSKNNYKVFLKKDYSKFELDKLERPFNKPDLVVFHGIYIKDYLSIYKELIKHNVPYIILPHSSLTAQAQNKKVLKKKIGNILFFNKYIKKALGIQFLTKNEYEESKKFKFQNYIISGNGTNKKDVSKKYDNVDYSKYVVTFIGRIYNYHKGLDVLIEAINLGKEEFRKYGIKVYLYGPNRSNSVEYLKEKIEEYQIADLVEIKSEVYLFIHTSRMEGHPTAIIEAISYGIPVLVTPGTNMLEEVEKYNLGFTAKLEPESIKQQIIYSYKNRNKFPEITTKELQYSNQNFDWETIMKETIDKYEKLLESRKK